METTTMKMFATVAMMLSAMACVSATYMIPMPPRKPTNFTVYVHENHIGANPTIVTPVFPSGNSSVLTFGAIRVLDYIVHTELSKNSSIIGSAIGTVVVGTGVNNLLDVLLVLNAKGLNGTIAAKGYFTSTGHTRTLAVLGGTGDFTFANGFVDTVFVANTDPADIVQSYQFSIRYY